MGVLYKEVDHIIHRQYKAEQEFLAEYGREKHTIANPYVKLNPYLIAPLTALVMFENEKPAFAKVTVKGKEAAGDMMYRPASDSIHMVLPILGLYPDYENTVVIELSTGETATLKIRTEAADDKLKAPTYMETTSEYLEDFVIMVSPTSPAYTAAYDYAGDVRWYNTLNLAFDIKRARNGRLLMGTDRLVAPPYHTTGVYEMGMIGKVYREYRIPGGYHHDEWEMENGDILICTKKLGTGIVTTASKVNLASKEAIDESVKQMITLNKYAAEVIVNYPVTACTDITGFGFLGHAYEMAKGSEKSLVFEGDFIPYITEAKEYAKDFLITTGGQQNRNFIGRDIDFGKTPLWLQEIMFDPQTSGGLLFSVKKDSVSALMKEFKEKNIDAYIIGSVEEKKDKYLIVR